MMLNHGYLNAEQFYDDVHFPMGFRKSGDFSIAEAELLTNIGRRLSMLEQGLFTPENDIEAQFVATCHAGAKPETKVEKLWLKYKTLSKPKPFHGLNGNTPSRSDDTSYSSSAQ